MDDLYDDLITLVLQCANQAAGTSLALPPAGDLPLEVFQFDSLSLFAFLLELERKCGLKFDEEILNHDQLRSIRSAAALIQHRDLDGRLKLKTLASPPNARRRMGGRKPPHHHKRPT